MREIVHLQVGGVEFHGWWISSWIIEQQLQNFKTHTQNFQFQVGQCGNQIGSKVRKVHHFNILFYDITFHDDDTCDSIEFFLIFFLMKNELIASSLAAVGTLSKNRIWTFSNTTFVSALIFFLMSCVEKKPHKVILSFVRWMISDEMYNFPNFDTWEFWNGKKCFLIK